MKSVVILNIIVFLFHEICWDIKFPRNYVSWNLLWYKFLVDFWFMKSVVILNFRGFLFLLSLNLTGFWIYWVCLKNEVHPNSSWFSEMFGILNFSGFWLSRKCVPGTSINFVFSNACFNTEFQRNLSWNFLVILNLIKFYFSENTSE